MNEIRFIDLFSGIGGFRLGLERASISVNSRTEQQGETVTEKKPGSGKGHNSMERDAILPKERTKSKWSSDGSTEGQLAFSCVWSNDIDKYANQIYTKNFGEKDHHPGDIRGVNPAEIPDFDLLCAGFPCQAFSVAGKRKGFQDTRGTLFFEICRIAAAKRPPLLLLENVKGLLSHARGETFHTILQSLEALGYWIEWQVLNSKYFGVPQNRERVFIIGHLRETSGREIFPITESDGLPFEERRVGEGISSCLDAHYAKGARKQRQFIIHRGYETMEGKPRIYKDICPTLPTSAGGGHIPEVANAVDPDGYLRFGHRPRDENGKPELVPIGRRRIRKLTPTECERLQGFPDGWTTGVSDTQRYKGLGNAVTVNVIEFLGERILQSCDRQ